MTVIKSVLATIIYIVLMELSGSWIFILERLESENYLNYYPLVQGTIQCSLTLIFILLITKRSIQNLVSKTNYKWYLIASILGILFVFFQTPLKWFYNFIFSTEYKIVYDFDGLQEFRNVNFISSILLIPLAEEMFFRLFIQTGLQKKTKPIYAIVITAILFAFIHSPYISLVLDGYNHGWHHFYLTLFGGLISGILFFKSKSLGPSVLFHIFWNLTVIIV